MNGKRRLTVLRHRCRGNIDIEIFSQSGSLRGVNADWLRIVWTRGGVLLCKR